MPYTASEYARYWTVAFFQKVAFLKIKYAAHPVSLENRLETLPQTYAYPSQSLCRCKTLAAELSVEEAPILGNGWELPLPIHL